MILIIGFLNNIKDTGLGDFISNEHSLLQLPQEIFGHGGIGDGLTASQTGQFQVFIKYQIG